MRPLVVETLLTYLELAGVMKQLNRFTTVPIYIVLQTVARKFSLDLILRVAEFLRGLFATAIKAEKWFSST